MAISVVLSNEMCTNFRNNAIQFFHRIKVMIAQGLYPFRVEKLNLAVPMVLRKRECRSLPLPIRNAWIF